MKYIYFDAFAGLSGDMILGALLDLGVDAEDFKQAMAALDLPVAIEVTETRRASLRGIKVAITVNREAHLHRKWTDISVLIEGSPFTPVTKERSLEIFQRLFQAEAHVHGRPFSETHLHEAGADDALIDIVGSCWLAEALDIQEFYASPLNVGAGWVEAAHGKLPVPPPAVAEILGNRTIYADGPKVEMVTPTGAAIISTLTQEKSSLPQLCYERIGWGAGGRDFPDFPNLLRVFYGESGLFRAETTVYQIEANIDDSNPQVLARFLDIALDLGALDAFNTPVVMKKNRLATKLTILVEHQNMDTLINAVFQETSTIGLRYFPVSRRILGRRHEKVSVRGEDIRIKIGVLEDEEINVQPEFEDCLKAAEKLRMPVKAVMKLAQEAHAERSRTDSNEE